MSRTSHLILPVFALLLAACSTVEERKPYDGPLSWPQPPDQPRFAYETMLRSLADIAVVSKDDTLLATFTGTKVTSMSTAPVLDKPSAIVARDGQVFVADTGSNSIAVFDIRRRRIYRFGTRDEYGGRLGKPAGIALDKSINVYVADSKLRKVMVYDRLGLFLGSVGGAEDLERPTGVAVTPDGTTIYVVDRSFNESNQHRVVVYGKGGKKIKEIGTRGSGEGQFNVPLQCALAPDGTLYVLDAGNFRVQAFDPEGKYLRSWGGAGQEFGNFGRPRGIAVDDQGLVYVTDASFNNFQIFNPNGQLLLAIGESSLESNPGQYGMLNGISVDETGRVYVVDQMYNKVEVIRRLSDSEGKKMLSEAQKTT